VALEFGIDWSVGQIDYFRVKERKLVILLASILAALVLVGTAWEKSQPFLRLFQRASSDAGEISKIRKEVEQQRNTITVIARDANNAHAEMEKALKLSSDAEKNSAEATRKTSEMTKLVSQASDALGEIKTTSDFAFLCSEKPGLAADTRQPHLAISPIPRANNSSRPSNEKNLLFRDCARHFRRAFFCNRRFPGCVRVPCNRLTLGNA